jgi:anaerobic selenocysteine-containing dehydrogenase
VLTRYAEPINIHIYSEVLQRFRLAAQGRSAGRQPPEHLRERIATHFDPLPFYSQPLEEGVTDLHRYPLNAITQRPMAMYHSWDSQNPWLRQIHTWNFLYVNTRTAEQAGIGDGEWMWVESMHGKVRCLCRHSEAVEPGTVWTWNAIGKASGASNSDPVTGQAGWYDVRVRIYPADAGEPRESEPQFDALGPVPGQAVQNNPGRWLSYFAGKGGKP